MLIRRKLTEVAIDSVTDYLKEKFEKLKLLDLDKDGVRDVDQIIEILTRCGQLAKEAFEMTDFQKLAAGLDQIIGGTQVIRSAVNAEKLAAVGSELTQGLKKLGELAQLGIVEMKERGEA
ncbi:MAG TPA: hypothetical protein V6D08_10155 [Candidatus Obscuribacterales bacterium]